MKEWQDAVDRWIQSTQAGYFSPIHNMIRLVEEMGELARALSQWQGFKKPKHEADKASVQEEMGDVLFVLMALANQLNIDLDQAMKEIMRKNASRNL